MGPRHTSARIGRLRVMAARKAISRVKALVRTWFIGNWMLRPAQRFQ